jgi:hypothetical protein
MIPFIVVTMCILSFTSASVLVIGSTGRLGRVVTANLVSRGVNTVALVRDVNTASKLAELKGAALMEGDVTDIDSLKAATALVDTVIDVHGVRPPRFVKLRDLFRAPLESDLTHPYSINYKGTRNLLEAMELNQNRKLVRLTGALVGASAFRPFVALFNFLLSFSNAWHEKSEKLIRESGIDYTVVRPSEIVDEPSCRGLTYPAVGVLPQPRHLVAVPGDGIAKIPVPSKISKYDVASLCVEAAVKQRHHHHHHHQDGGSSFLSRSTVVCCSQAGEGPTSFDDLFYDDDGAKCSQFTDTKAIVPGRHGLATLLYSSFVTVVLALLVQGVKSAGILVFTAATKLVRLQGLLPFK